MAAVRPRAQPSARSAPAMTPITQGALEREFYRYYHQPRQNSSQVSCVPPPEPRTPTAPCPVEIESTEAVPANDKALTAFAQLGALRLNARRCMISFFDRKYSYVLAEATRTLSLETGQARLDEDNIFWGVTFFPRTRSICNYTVNLPAMYETGDDGKQRDVTSFVVNDLATDPRFSHLPWLSSKPNTRFYAGVPIRSPDGHSIGAYCVLDDQPRDGICADDLDFMKDMAITVMTHLKMTKITDEHRRGGLMVKSLGCFVEGKSSMEDLWQDPWEEGMPNMSNDNAGQRQRRRGHSRNSPSDGNTKETSWSISSPNDSERSHFQTSASSSVVASPAAVTPATDATDVHSPQPVSEAAAPKQRGNLQEQLLAPDVKTTFTRAANIIYEATEADGVVFFDASIGTFGGQVDDELAQDQPPETSKDDKVCGVLGAQPEKQHSMTEPIMRHLLNTYKKGQIFNLSEETNTLEPASSTLEKAIAGTQETPRSSLTSSPSKRPEACKTLSDDELLLHEIFPEAKSLVLSTLWDSHRERFFAGAIIWTTDPKRVFTNEQELSYLAAFGNSVMAEVARLDTSLADKAKSDFISSISHELRSPLHGILGCCDLLKATMIDSYQSDTARTIETCGNTLLDTINSVLTYAKINTLKRESSKRSRGSKSKRSITTTASSGTDNTALISDTDLSVLTEEVLETVFAGHQFQKNVIAPREKGTKSKANPDQSSIAVIVDVNQSENWCFRTQPGTWGRVLMNLFGNALKYTDAGYIKVKLQATARKPIEGGISELKLTIADSGIGMSAEYLRSKLYTSFAQEDPLNPGTGLGLHIVKHLVEDELGGKIDVISEKNVGTKITIICPMKQSVLSPIVCPSQNEKHMSAIRKRSSGLKVAFVGFDGHGDYFSSVNTKKKTATALTKKAFEGICKDWFDLKVIDENPEESPDLYIATEAGASSLRARYSQAPESADNVPVIVVCQAASLVHAATAITTPGHITECISQPCGPHKLAKALVSCLDRYDTRKAAALEDFDLKDPKPTATTPSEPARPVMSQSYSSPAVSYRPTAKAPPTDHQPLSILCVDDNAVNLKLLTAFIDKMHHDRRIATNGLEAVELYKSATSPTQTIISTDTGKSSPDPSAPPTHFDVVLMDINMPEMDGLEATRQIRAHEREAGWPPATIIAFTGLASAQAQQEAFTSGINLFLIKPVRYADLNTVLKGVVTSRAAEVEAKKVEASNNEENALLQTEGEVQRERAGLEQLEKAATISSDEEEFNQKLKKRMETVVESHNEDGDDKVEEKTETSAPPPVVATDFADDKTPTVLSAEQK